MHSNVFRLPYPSSDDIIFFGQVVFSSETQLCLSHRLFWDEIKYEGDIFVFFNFWNKSFLPYFTYLIDTKLNWVWSNLFQKTKNQDSSELLWLSIVNKIESTLVLIFFEYQIWIEVYQYAPSESISFYCDHFSIMLAQIGLSEN